MEVMAESIHDRDFKTVAEAGVTFLFSVFKPTDATWVRVKHPTLRTNFVVSSWLLLVVYLVSLPALANWANNLYFDYTSPKRAGSGLCTVPANEMYCTDGQDFEALALQYRGAAVGCGCGQGIFGEALCPVAKSGYTISALISTSTGTGLMAALTTVPNLATWWYIDVINAHFKPHPFLQSASWWTMALFQVSFGLFLACSDCVFPTLHNTFTVVWIIAFVAHSLCVLWTIHVRDAVGQLILSLLLTALIFVLLLPIGPHFNRSYGSYLFFLGECVPMVCLFGISPMLLIFGYHSPCGQGSEKLPSCMAGFQAELKDGGYSSQHEVLLSSQP